ncbi:hypothetical protein M407DRAFT_220405 [Tulasnella calospora MUT 4182]|uniref:Wax synthase domain-containing protein n=1 Tax=Tulasnella calospora MUT 4182 TaxID=1051891 RepID=A0A0C3QT62_9AGAM|nr:hypothetical protein M407DRAFT_220405 [Tulasnella calospora MUT 4182]
MAAKNRGLFDLAVLLLPNLIIPPEAFPAMTGALLILGFCVYTTVLPNHKTWAPLRIGLAIPAIYLFIDYGWSRAYPRETRAVHLGMGTTAFYGIMKVIEVCWVRELDDERPKWVLKPGPHASQESRNGNDDVKPEVPTVLPLPEDTWGRITYAFDFLSSVRGASWFGDRVWDFAPSYIYNYSRLDRLYFVLFNIVFLLLQYLAADFFDVYVKSLHWDRTNGTPATSLPVPLQITTVLMVGLQTILALTISTTSFATIAVSLGSNPSSWVPILPNVPFAAPTIQEFWSTYWHHIFRRVWRRMATGIVWFVPASLKTNPTTVRILRHTAVFFLSSALHSIILAGIPSKLANPMPRPFLGVDAGTFKFFFTQPLGLVLEALLVFPLTEGFEPYTRTELRRAFGWIWFLFTGRYWCDAWIGHGLFEPMEIPISISPIRGVLYGQWVF